ncbi:MAG: asparagine synthase C-terminal domain-containing protein [Actinomycetia bacterium]|nr:asparagine synthase C-terminal domain-containing protein [Actinomycetes bacterium]
MELADRPETGSRQVVFLSGGLDSRMILAGLTEVFDSSEIVAATFGRPGEQDFDFAAMVAQEAGVQHERLESSSVDWTTDGLVDSVLARELPLAAPFGQRYLSYLLHQQLGRDSVFWDGLCGGPVAGSAQGQGADTGDWEAALEHFIQLHLLADHQQLVTSGFDPRSLLPKAPTCPQELMSYRQQLDFGIRQRCRIGTRLLRNYQIRLPFLAGPWLHFMLAVPSRYRNNKYLYREIAQEAFPRLFALPTTASLGDAPARSRAGTKARQLKRRATRKAREVGLFTATPSPPASGANTWLHGSVVRPGLLRDLAQENIADLARRGIVDWADVLAHAPEQSAAPDYRVVTRLLNLELNLKTSEMVGDGGLEPPTSSV